MKAQIIFLMCLCFAGGMKAQTSSQEIDAKLRHIYIKDQEVRKQWGKIAQTNNIDSIMDYQQQMEQTDKANQTYVFRILDTQGWPQHVSDSAHQAIFLVIDHAELEAQKHYFPLIQEQVKKGNLSPSDVATLQDRIRMREGKKQIYGTQTKNGEKNGKQACYVWPIENPAAVDSLRQSVGLPSMQEYLNMFQQFGEEAIWDKTLTIEEAKQLTKLIIIKK